MGPPWKGWIGAVSAAKGHSTLVGWASVMTFANVVLVFIIMRSSFAPRNPASQLQLPGSPATPLSLFLEGGLAPSRVEQPNGERAQLPIRLLTVPSSAGRSRAEQSRPWSGKFRTPQRHANTCSFEMLMHHRGHEITSPACVQCCHWHTRAQRGRGMVSCCGRRN